MAVDKLVDSAQLDSGLTAIANAIRLKGGTDAYLAFPSDFITAIEAISGGGSGPTTEVVIPEQTLNVTSIYTQIPTVYEALIEGETYIYTINGTSYTEVARSQQGSIVIGQSQSTTGIFDNSGGTMYFDMTVNGTYVVKVEKVTNSGEGGSSLKYETGTFTLSSDVVLNSSTCYSVSHGLGEIPDVVIVTPKNTPSVSGDPNRGYVWLNAPMGETQQYLSSSATSSYPICVQYYVSALGPPLKTRFNVQSSDSYMFRAGTMPTASDFKLFRQSSSTTFYAGDYNYFIAKKWW